MKKLLFLSAALAAVLFSSCQRGTTGNEDNGPEFKKGVAYVAIHIETEGTRADTSGEQAGSAAENTLTSLYLITFKEGGSIVAKPDGTYFSVINGSDTTPDATAISASSDYIVVIANPGAQLVTAITGLGAGSTITSLNAAITVTSGHVAGIIDAGSGYTMISSDDASAVNGKVLYPYVAIGEYLKVVDGANPDEAAKAAAEATRLPVKLERLASKLVVAQASQVNVVGGTFGFTGWTVDAVNSKYYPFAEKTQIDGTHTGASGATPVYAKAFYTKDPNYIDKTGILYAEVDNSSFELKLPMTGGTNGWYPTTGANDVAYVIENTMAAESQSFGNATRIVIKATYYPTGFSAGQDWFSYQGVNYASLELLQAAYNDGNASDDLKNACVLFFNRINAYAASHTPLTATNFATLTQAELDTILPGAEVTKDDAGGTANNMAGVIRWYKDAVCYYYYEIRHNNSDDLLSSAYTKYGVVRNNWYSLTLNKVNGPGTPWYPELPDPGPGDPKPDDPIDDQAAYLGVTVTINPWILRETGFEI
jgi:hypothetical protein